MHQAAKWMLTLAAAALLLAGCGARIQLSGPVPPLDRVEAMTVFLDDELQLSEEERQVVHRLLRESVQRRQRIDQTLRGRPLEVKEQQQKRLRTLRETVDAMLETPAMEERWRYIWRQIREDEMEPYKNANPRQPRNPGQGVGAGPMGY